MHFKYIKITIVGLLNAGKSTLFNRLLEKKVSLVSKDPGLTRDRIEGIGRISDLKFKIVDTGGWNDKTSFSMQIIEQIEFSISDSDIIFFLVDIKIQNQQNKDLAKWLRKKTNKPIILIGNKSENYKKLENVDYLKFFNFIGPVYISAEHNLGMADLYDILIYVIKYFNINNSSFLKKNIQLNNNYFFDKTINNSKLKIAIIGRSNVGKSTFLNNLLSKNRLITNSLPYTTHDSVSIEYNYNGKIITLIDTAGIYKKANIKNVLELKFIKKTTQSVRSSHIVILMLDSLIGICQQDLSICEYIIKNGKGIIIALNKWDLINKSCKNKFIKFLKQKEISNFFLEIPIITISALKGIRCIHALDKCIELSKLLNKKINTAKLNKWLICALNKHVHPLVNGKNVKIKYIVQIGTNPPAFSLKCNFPKSIDESYKRYLIKDLRKNFFDSGIPIRLLFKKNKNPYLNN